MNVMWKKAGEHKAGQTTLCQAFRTRLRSSIAITSFKQCTEELIVNSLDSLATCISIRINLPKGYVQVLDNGNGISQSSMFSVGERYNSSKSSKSNNQKFGYRGEALASIIELSESVEIISKAQKDDSITVCKRFTDGLGTLKKGTEERPVTGTTVTVKQLFCKHPVRRKHMLDSQSLCEVQAMVQMMGIMFPNVAFGLRDETSCTVLVNTSKMTSSASVIKSVFGEDYCRDLQEVHSSYANIKLDGVISLACHQSKKMRLISVNKHILKYTRLHQAVEDQLKNSLITHKSKQEADHVVSKSVNFAYAINIACDKSIYDITFHPDKSTVEFSCWDEVLKAIRLLIKDFLKQNNMHKGTTTERCEQEHRPRTEREDKKKRHSRHRKPMNSDMKHEKEIRSLLDVSPIPPTHDEQAEPFSVPLHAPESPTQNLSEEEPEDFRAVIYWLQNKLPDIIPTAQLEPISCERNVEKSKCFPLTASSVYPNPNTSDRSDLSSQHFSRFEVGSAESTASKRYINSSLVYKGPDMGAQLPAIYHNRRLFRINKSKRDGFLCTRKQSKENEHPLVVHTSQHLQEHLTSPALYHHSLMNEFHTPVHCRCCRISCQNTGMHHRGSTLPVYPHHPLTSCESRFNRTPVSSYHALSNTPAYVDVENRHETIESTSFVSKTPMDRDLLNCLLAHEEEPHRMEYDEFASKRCRLTPPINDVVHEPVSSDKNWSRFASPDGNLYVPDVRPDNRAFGQSEVHMNSHYSLHSAIVNLDGSESSMSQIFSDGWSEEAILPDDGSIFLHAQHKVEQEFFIGTYDPWALDQTLSASEKLTSVNDLSAHKDEISATVISLQNQFKDNSLHLSHCCNQSVSDFYVKQHNANLHPDLPASDDFVKNRSFNDSLPEQPFCSSQNTDMAANDDFISNRSINNSIHIHSSPHPDLPASDDFVSELSTISDYELEFGTSRPEARVNEISESTFSSMSEKDILNILSSRDHEKQQSVFDSKTITPLKKIKLPSFTGTLVQPVWKSLYLQNHSTPGSTPNVTRKAVPHRIIAMSRDALQSCYVIGQWADNFILCAERDNIFAMDQHAVDERIRLEMLESKAYPPGGQTTIYKLAQPVKLVTSHKQLLTETSAQLRNMGFIFEMDGDTATVNSVPQAISYYCTDSAYVKDCIEGVAFELSQQRIIHGRPRIVQDALNSQACRGAIMFGESLSRQHCFELITQLAACRLPFQCAHGRPTCVPLTRLPESCREQTRRQLAENIRRRLNFGYLKRRFVMYK